MGEQTYVFREGPYDGRLMKTNVILPGLFLDYRITDETEMTNWGLATVVLYEGTADSEGLLL